MLCVFVLFLGFFLVWSLVVGGVIRPGILIDFLCYVFLALCLTCDIWR